MEKQIIIGTSGGFYPKPISMLVQMASRYDSSVYLQKGSHKINVKSIVGVLSIRLKSGDKVTLITSGTDEAAALQNIETFLTSI